ncbi:MAG: FAD-dependent oxidoreductase, partial [Candidatus Marinimicrobia bacterium]|nr:FAD-dependent oxidoreductase [Candidatus Neomarinimicrobiota bacterium]
MQRRRFLQTFLGASFLLVNSDKILTAEKTSGSQEELSADLAVIGGSLGGCAAALAAARNGQTVILTEESDWIGGQLTSQAVPPDEHPWIEQFGCTRSYRELRNSIRQYYLQNYPLTTAANDAAHLNPGNCGVSRLCHEPAAALFVLESMFASYVSSGQVRILRRTRPVSVDAAHDEIRAIEVEYPASGNR